MKKIWKLIRDCSLFCYCVVGICIDEAKAEKAARKKRRRGW